MDAGVHPSHGGDSVPSWGPDPLLLSPSAQWTSGPLTQASWCPTTPSLPFCLPPMPTFQPRFSLVPFHVEGWSFSWLRKGRLAWKGLIRCSPCVGDAQRELSVLAELLWEEGLGVLIFGAGLFYAGYP